MEPSSEAKRAIALKPSQTVLTAFPYRPHSALLDLLRGEPKVLGAVQILLALSILGIGIIFLLSYISFSIQFPVVFLTGYPFWGALIFILAGCLTITDQSKKSLGLGITTVHVISCLVAVAGIALTILSYPKQHRFCQNYQPSFEGVCALGRILLTGILSILLIISIVELSISVTVASLRAKCWMKSNEVVFFLPADITQSSEQSADPEENVQLKFELQNDSTSDDATKTEIVFFGSYAFFKLKVSRITSSSPPTLQPHPTGGDDYDTTSAFVPDMPLSFKLLGEENKLKQLPPILEKKISDEKKSSDDTIYAEPDFTTGQQKDKDIEYASVQHPQMQLQLLKGEDLPIKNFLIDSVQNPQPFPPNDLPSQALTVQHTPGKGLFNNSPPSHIMQSYDLTSEDLPFQDIPSIDKLSQDTKFQDTQPTTKSSQDTPSQHIISEEMQYGVVPSQDTRSQNSKSQSISSHDKLPQNTESQNMPFQDVTKSTSQDTLSQNTPSQDMTFQTLPTHVQSSSTQQLSEQSPDHQPQNIQAQKQRSSQVLYQDIQSEVLELTQGWKSLEELHGRKSSRRHSSDWQSKEEQSPRRHSLELQSKGSPPAKRKSIDQQIKGWLFPRRHSVDKKTQYTQTSEQLSEQQTEDQQAKVEQSSDRKGEQVLKERFGDMQSEDQLAAKKQTQGQQIEDQWGSPSSSQFPEEQPPEWTTQNWQSSNQQSQDWRKNNWQNKDWKTQEWQFEMQHSLNWDPQARQTQGQLEEETLKQKALQQEDQTQHTMKRYYFGQQSQHFLCQDSQNQDKNQQNFLFRFTMKEDTQTDRIQTTDNQLADMKYRDQQPVDLQSEDMKPDCHPSSSQSLEQDTCLACSSNIGSEQDVQQNTSVCSDSYKEDVNFLSSSCHSKEQQQSEESD